jgi:hypothetical protein
MHALLLQIAWVESMSASSGSGIPADGAMVPVKGGECKKKPLLI